MMTRALLLGLCCVELTLTPQLGAQQTRDTVSAGFLLTTDDPNRSPSPFIGNGHLGLVIPALGIEIGRAHV